MKTLVENFAKICKEYGGKFEEPEVCVVDDDKKFLKMINDNTWEYGKVVIREHLPNDTHLYLTYSRYGISRYLNFHFAQKPTPDYRGFKTFKFEVKVKDDDIKLQDWLR